MLVTALIVARPLVLGEDPGLAFPGADNASMVLSLLWLFAGLGWAVWRLVARRDEWHIGMVEAALGIAVALFFASAETAANKHPARLIAWEWLVLVFSFIVVRHLAAKADARHGLFAAFLATGVMVAAYGVYQAVVEVPAAQQKSKDRLWELAASQGMRYDDATFEVFYKRVQDGHVYGPFAHPNSFAGYLALVVPGLIGAVVVCGMAKGGADLAKLAPSAMAVVFGLAAVWVTHSRGAMLALALVGVGTAAFSWRRHLLARKAWTVAAISAVAVAAVLVWRTGLFSSGLGKDTGTMAARLDYWRATVKMIRDHAWLGVGPGNFGGYYPRYMAATAGEKIKDPHNFVLELWATGGVFTLLAVLAALGAAFVLAARSGTSPERERGDSLSTTFGTGRWEYYVGGGVGLLIAFGLRIASLGGGPDQVLQEGLASAARSVVWFFAFLLFDRIAWTDRQRVFALAAGVAALLLNLCVSGGIGSPSVAGPLWIAVALLLASLPIAPRVIKQYPLPSLGLPIVGSVAVILVYIMFCFYPTSSALGLMRKAQNEARLFQSNRVVLAEFCAGTVGLYAAPAPQTNLATLIVFQARTRDLREWAAYGAAHIEQKVLKPLQEASLDDPDNPRIWIQLGQWYLQDWEFRHAQQLERLSAGALNRAHDLNPQGLEPLQAKVQMALTLVTYADTDLDRNSRLIESNDLAFRALKNALGLSIHELERRHKLFEDNEKRFKDARREHLTHMLEKLREAIALDPTDAPLRYQMAEVLNRNGEHAACREEADMAIQFHDVSTHGPRRLSDPQLSRARTWAGIAPTP